MLNTKRKRILFVLSICAIGAILVTINTFKPTRGAQDRAELMLQVKVSQDIPIAVEPVSNAPFSIEHATVKQINGTLYGRIIRDNADSDADRMSLPDFSARNTSDKAIQSLGVCIASRSQTSGTLCFIKRELDLKPGEAVTITRGEMVWYRINLRARAPQAHSVVPKHADTTSDFGAPEMWLKAVAGDSYMFLVNAEFADGSIWTHPAVAAAEAAARK